MGDRGMIPCGLVQQARPVEEKAFGAWKMADLQTSPPTSFVESLRTCASQRQARAVFEQHRAIPNWFTGQ